MFSKLKEIKKFTPKEEVEKIIGKPKFRLEHRSAFASVYYYGNGILIAYAPYRFKNERVGITQYGEEGCYATTIYHFADIEMLKLHFGPDSFEAEDIICDDRTIIDGEINYSKTFKDIQKMELKKLYPGKYMYGETRKMADGDVQVTNLFIMYGAYTLFFKGNSENGLLSGVQYTLPD